MQVTNTATDPDVPPQILTYSLPTAPVGAIIDLDRPLSGLSGRIVTINADSATVCMRLDFIGQGALVVVETSNVEPE